MNHRERMQKTFGHEEADRIPVFEQAIDSKVASAILGRDVLTGGTGLWKHEAEASLKGESAYQEFIEKMLDDTIELYNVLEMDGGEQQSEKIFADRVFRDRLCDHKIGQGKIYCRRGWWR